MSYPKTGNEVFVSFSLSNTMFSGLGKGTITREEVSADYLKDLFQKYGVMVSARGRISGGHLQLCEVLCPEPAL